MSISEARQQSLLAGCNSLELKVFEFVPIQEPWPAEQINRHMQAGGRSSTEYRRVRAALGGLKDRGLIRETKRDIFQREQIKIRELRDAVADVVTPPKLGDLIDIKAIRSMAVPYVPPASQREIAVEFEKDFNATIGGVLSKDAQRQMHLDKSAPAPITETKPEPVVKEVVTMNAIAKTVPTQQTAADMALDAISEITQELDTINSDFDAQLVKLNTAFNARMNTLRERMEVVALEVEELRDHENKAFEKFRAFKALMTTLSDD